MLNFEGRKKFKISITKAFFDWAQGRLKKTRKKIFLTEEKKTVKFFGECVFFDPWPRRSNPFSFLSLRTRKLFESSAKRHYGRCHAIGPEEGLHDAQGHIFERLKSPSPA